MPSLPCLSCSALPASRLPRIASSRDVARLATAFAAFSTSAVRPANPLKKKATNPLQKKSGGRDRQSFKLKPKKKGAAVAKANPPKPGERKALRRRIVLSNTSALEVPGLQEMTLDMVKDGSNVGSVVALPGQVVDQLRAAQSFKKTQSWSFFRKPSTLIRKETVELANEMDTVDKKTLRRIFTGERGSGKSLLLLQATAFALQKGWIVVSIPEAQYLTDGSSDYRPMANTKPIIYEQGQYSMEMLRRIVATNPSLKDLPVKLQHHLPTALPTKASLFDLCELGVEDTEIASAALMAFFKELAGPDAPPSLLAMDSLAYAMRDSKYESTTLEPIHAHEFAIVDWFMSYLSGEKSLPNGGMVVAATSASNDPKHKSLDFRLHQLEIKQALEKGLPSPAEDAHLPDPMLPFLLATGQQPNPVPQPDPFYQHDHRVFKVLGNPFGVAAGNNTASESEVVVRKVKGMSREEARGLMEYWAKSGMMRQEVNERFVSEKWTVSGGGVVGELERGCFRFRV